MGGASKQPRDPASRGAAVALAPVPREISEASRLGLISPDEFVHLMVRHVRAEMRRNGDLTVADLVVEDGGISRRRALGIVAVALITDLSLAAGVLCGSGHL
jgi:hypothetical protein